MMPRGVVSRKTGVTDEELVFESSWVNFHPDDLVQEYIFNYLKQHYQENLSTIIVYEGHMIYIHWYSIVQCGLSIIMDSVSNNFNNIGEKTMNWMEFVKGYHSFETSSKDEMMKLLESDYSKVSEYSVAENITRLWFDIATAGGKFVLDMTTGQVGKELSTIVTYFPWILFLKTEGSVTDSVIELDVEVISEFQLNKEEIFKQINQERSGLFWKPIYHFVIRLQNVEKEKRADILLYFLQAVYDFNTEILDYEKKIKNIFQYKEILSYFEFDILGEYIKKLLIGISNTVPTREVCDLLLQFSDLLLEFDFTDLARLTEGTALEHALKLDHNTKLEVIIQLTNRSSNWGDQHLVSFIQSLTGLLPHDEGGKEILSEVINLVKDRLNQSWDGMLCVVEGKIIANKIEDACELRFLASGMISDKFTRAEDIFSSIVWSLQYEIAAQKLFELSQSYLNFAFDTLSAEEIIDQSDVLIQRSLLNQKYEFLRYYFQYLRTHLHMIDQDYYRQLLSTIDQLLTDKRLYPLIYIEYLILQMFVLYEIKEQNVGDEIFQLMSQVFNHINPSLSTTQSTLQYISSQIIRFGANTHNWAIIEETQRRYLLLSSDQTIAKQHLKTIFLQTALERSKLPGKKLQVSDIGVTLFDEGLKLADLVRDYDIIVRIIPQIKKMAIKSRSYVDFGKLILAEIKLKKLHEKEWIDGLVADIDRILGRLTIDEINKLFQDLFNLDLTEKEERGLIIKQLELVESEPDLLSADEIYTKRLKLGKSQEDSSENIEFIIENYQQGISELMSKGDTGNLTNLLLEAITYSQAYNVPELKEFKDLLIDNFENITQEFHSSQTSEMYLYMMTIWRKVINDFKNSDLSIVVTFALKLYRLNLIILDVSNNNQYLRRAQLIMKELSIVIKHSDLSLDDEDTIQIYEELEKLFLHFENKHRDFGIISSIQQAALIYYNLDQTNALFSRLDTGINQIKREIINDDTASSGIFLLLLLLCEVGNRINAEFDHEIMMKLSERIKKVMNFALSLNLTPIVKKQLSDLHDKLFTSPERFIHEFPASLGNYIDSSPQL